MVCQKLGTVGLGLKVDASVNISRYLHVLSTIQKPYFWDLSVIVNP
jgi:hypothetical protein